MRRADRTRHEAHGLFPEPRPMLAPAWNTIREFMDSLAPPRGIKLPPDPPARTVKGRAAPDDDGMRANYSRRGPMYGVTPEELARLRAKQDAERAARRPAGGG